MKFNIVAYFVSLVGYSISSLYLCAGVINARVEMEAQKSESL